MDETPDRPKSPSDEPAETPVAGAKPLPPPGSTTSVPGAGVTPASAPVPEPELPPSEPEPIASEPVGYTAPPAPEPLSATPPPPEVPTQSMPIASRGTSDEEIRTPSAEPPHPHDDPELTSRRRRVVGIILVIVGVLFFAQQYLSWNWDRAWPVILIAIGAALLFWNRNR